MTKTKQIRRFAGCWPLITFPVLVVVLVFPGLLWGGSQHSFPRNAEWSQREYTPVVDDEAGEVTIRVLFDVSDGGTRPETVGSMKATATIRSSAGMTSPLLSRRYGLRTKTPTDLQLVWVPADEGFDPAVFDPARHTITVDWAVTVASPESKAGINYTHIYTVTA